MNTLPNLNFPLDFTFKISTLSSDFNITDNQGNYVGYVRQKMFKLKEDVIVFANESRTTELFRIRANKWLDFNTTYSIYDQQSGNVIGKVARKGMKSLWKSHYVIFNAQDQEIMNITEDNAWTKVFDSLVGEIPIIGMFTGYFLNPSYSATTKDNQKTYQLKKLPSFFGRKFSLSRTTDRPDEEETLAILSFMMMVLLERARG